LLCLCVNNKYDHYILKFIIASEQEIIEEEGFVTYYFCNPLNMHNCFHALLHIYIHTQETLVNQGNPDVGYSGSKYEKWKTVHNGVHTLKDTWHLGRQMSILCVQTKLDNFFKPALLHSKTSTASKSSIDE
jgi:YHS domain-containing protein